MLLYGAHSWALTATQLGELEVWQHKQLRELPGPQRWAVPPGGPGEPKYISNEQLLRRCGDWPGMAEQLPAGWGASAGSGWATYCRWTTAGWPSSFCLAS